MVRLSSLADVSSMVDKDVGKTPPPGFRQEFTDVLLNDIRIFVFRQAQPERKPFDVRIYHYAWYIKDRAQNAVCRLSPYPGQFSQFLHGGRYFAAIEIHQAPAAPFDEFCLIPEKSGWMDILFQLRNRRINKRLWAFVFFEKRLGDPVDLFVRTLGRQDCGDKELKGRPVLERRLILRV